MGKVLIDTIVPNDFLKGKRFYVRKTEGNTYVEIKFKEFTLYSTFTDSTPDVRDISAILADGNEIKGDAYFFRKRLSELGYDIQEKRNGHSCFIFEKNESGFMESEIVFYDNSSWSIKSMLDVSEIRSAKPKYWYSYENHEVKSETARVFYNIVSGRMSLYDNTEKRFATREECESANALKVVSFEEEEIGEEKRKTLKEIEETEKKMAELQKQLVKLRGAL